ncbi:MAG TPA: EF-P lysine aminoacylase EpmA [Beijerinckiaceae bacterium]|nr:EF-P lysine aminoacylase EpmA [Beijerinckiaceae bacterium]
MIAPSPWWMPDRHADRRPFLIARNRIAAAVRAWFESRDFVEATPSGLQVSPGNEAHLHAFSTELRDVGGAATQRYLHTSPEFSCKKLLAAGEARLFTLGPVWRNREGGPLHAPEFTMLEWYRAREDYGAIMEDCAALLRLAAETTETTKFSWKGRVCDAFSTPERLTLQEAFARHAGTDLRAADRDSLAGTARRLGLHQAQDDTWSDLFSRILGAVIEPHLGFERPTILYEYPASEAAMARRKPDDPAVSERFELYVCGVELANCFGELTDPVEQRARFETEMLVKQEIFGEKYPIDEAFIAALALMPPASGGALGFDRLVMLATGATHIDQVQWAPVARGEA